MSDTPLGQPLAPAPDPASATEQVTPEEGGTTSVLAELREARKHLGVQAAPLDVAVPGYNGLLILRCRWVPPAEVTKGISTLKQIQDPTERQVAAAADTLIHTCQEFLIRVGDETRPLSQDETPITFADPRLASQLAFDVGSSARQNARRTFNNDYALIETSNKVMAWLQDTTRAVNGEFLGN